MLPALLGDVALRCVLGRRRTVYTPEFRPLDS